MGKILVLAETIDQNSSSAGKVNYGMVQSLQTAGFELTVYHYSHHPIIIPRVKTILITENKVDINYWLSRGQRVAQRLSGKNFSRALEKRFGFSFTFFNDTSSMTRALDQEDPEEYDAIITLSKAASYRTHAALLKLPQWHGKWLAYIHDPYPHHWYPKPYQWIESGWKQKQDFFLQVAQKARWLGYPSQNLAAWMGEFDDRFQKKAVLLPHQCIERNHHSIDLPTFFQGGGFNILHAGNLMSTRNPLPLVRAWRLFVESIPMAVDCCKLYLIGPASHFEEQILNEIQEDASVFFYHGNMSHEIVLKLESLSSANVILESVADCSPFLPGKFSGLVKVDKPIIHLGPNNSEVRRLLGKDYPYVAVADDVQAIQKILLDLHGRWKRSESLRLDRPDLQYHISSRFVKSQLEQL